MARTSKWDKVNPDLEYQGSKITLPGDPSKMPIAEAIKALERKQADEETPVHVVEVIECYPADALVAFNKAMQRTYGWASPVPTPGFWGDTPPRMMTIKTGPKPGESVQVPWGQFVVPNVSGKLMTDARSGKNGMEMVIVGKVAQKDKQAVKALAELTREILLTESIYKGKAIQISTDIDGGMEDSAPEFMETDHIVPEELILNDIEYEQVKCALWAPIRHTESCLKYKIPLKRGVLLEGTYGTGKTMTANVTARVSVDNDWTFILLDDVRALESALRFAQRYAPAVVFSEDVDRVIEERDQRANDILNTIDGILSKNAQVITVLTTNHVEKLDKAMLRPGRLDAVIHIAPPETESVQRLIRLYGRDLILFDEDLSEVGEKLSGNIPATIREVVERSKLSMIDRGGNSINQGDLLISAEGMARHLSLLSEVKEGKSAGDKLGEALRKILVETDTINGIKRDTETILESM